MSLASQRSRHIVDFTSELTPAIKCGMGSEMKAIFSPTKVWLDACAQSCALSNNLPSRKTVFALVMANDTVIVTPSNIYANGPFIFFTKSPLAGTGSTFRHPLSCLPTDTNIKTKPPFESLRVSCVKKQTVIHLLWKLK